MSFSPDGRLLATASEDRTIVLWEVETGLQLRTIAGGSSPIMSVVFSPTGKVLASMNNEGKVAIWDVLSGGEIFSTAGNYLGLDMLAFSPDGRILAYVGFGEKSQKLAGSVSRSSTIYLLDTLTKTSSRLPEEYYTPTLPIAFGKEGENLAFVENDTLRFWDTKAGGKIKSLELGVAGSVSHRLGTTTITTRTINITSLSFSHDGKKLAIGGAGFGGTRLEPARAIAIIDLVKFKVEPSNPILRFLLEQGFSSRLVAFNPKNGKLALGESVLAYSPDGNILATDRRNGRIVLSNLYSAEKLVFVLDNFTGGSGISRRGGRNIFLSPSGKLFVTGRDDTSIDLLSTATGAKLRSLTPGVSAITAIAFSSDGRLLASAGGNNVIKLFDMTNSRYVRSFSLLSEGNTEVVLDKSHFSEQRSGVLDIDEILGKDKNNQRIKIMKLDDGQVESDLPPDDPLRALLGTVTRDIEISPDGRMLAAGGDDQIVRVWDLTTGKRIYSLVGHTNIITTVAFSPDSNTLASGGEDKTIRLWSTRTGLLQQSLIAPRAGRVLTMAFSPNGKTLASGGDDSTVRLWNIETRAQEPVISGFAGDIYSVSFSDNGKQLRCGSSDGMVAVWDLSSGTKLSSIPGRVTDNKRAIVRFDGEVLAIGRDDGKIALLSSPRNVVIGYLIPFNEKDWLTITPEALFDGTNNAWNQIIWRSPQNTFDFAPVEGFFTDFYHPGLLSDLLAGNTPKAPRNVAEVDRRQPQVKLALSQASSDAIISTRISTVNVDISQAPAGARDVRLFRNGLLVKVWRGDVLKGKSSVSLEATVPFVAGENRLTAYAFNHDNIKSSDAALVVVGAESLRRRGNAYVLAVGVNEYFNTQYNLKYAAADSQDFAAEVKRQQLGLGIYATVEVIPLLNKDATKTNFLKALAGLAAKVQPEDAVIIYFAGHGVASGNRFYLVPHDLGYAGSRTALDQAGLDQILTHSISDEELETAVEGIDAGQMLMVIDACNSGQALEAEEKRRGPMNSKGLAQLAYEKGMYILTAAQSYQAALEASRLGHGYLTYALVEEGLKTNAADATPKDGQLLLREWLDYATNRVPQMQQEKINTGAQVAAGNRLLLQQVVAFTNGEENLDPAERSLQRPRVFYRRETEAQPLIVARPR